MAQEYQGASQPPYKVSINEKGILKLPQALIDWAGLEIGAFYQLSWVDRQPFVLLLQENPSRGCRLSEWQNEEACIGGELNLQRFCRKMLTGCLSIPLYDLEAIPLIAYRYHLAFFLEECPWLNLPFSPASLPQLSRESYGIYELLTSRGRLLKVAEGPLQDSLETALQSDWTDIHKFRYFPLYGLTKNCKADGLIYKKLLLEAYRDTHRGGRLPKYNL